MCVGADKHRSDIEMNVADNQSEDGVGLPTFALTCKRQPGGGNCVCSDCRPLDAADKKKETAPGLLGCGRRQEEAE